MRKPVLSAGWITGRWSAQYVSPETYMTYVAWGRTPQIAVGIINHFLDKEWAIQR